MVRNFVLTGTLVAVAVTNAAETLTLEAAVALALDNNSGLRTYAIEAAKAQDRLAATRTRQFPGVSLYVLGAQQLRSFDFTLEKGVLGSYAGTGPLPGEDVHLKTPLEPTGLVIARVTQPLTSLIRIRRSMDTLKNRHQAGARANASRPPENGARDQAGLLRSAASRIVSAKCPRNRPAL